MDDIINIAERRIGEISIPTVNARDLHEFLQVGKDFSNWIKDRIEQYGFVEHLDFEVFANSGENPSGGRPAKEYALSIDMAKELAMVERSEKGKQVRQYFIECERRMKSASPFVIPKSLPEALRLAADESDRADRAEAELAIAAPKAEALDRIATADGSLCLRDAAKALQVRPIDLTRWLQAHGWIYRRVGNAHWLGYQDKILTDLLEHKITVVSRDDGSDKIVEQVRVTAKGISRLASAMTDIAHNDGRRITAPNLIAAQPRPREVRHGRN